MDDQSLEQTAATFGVEIDAAEARQWMLAVDRSDDADVGIARDASGVFGGRVALLDFDTDGRLYQMPGLLEAADAALDESSGIDRATVLRQLALVTDAVADVTEGEEEQALLAALRELTADAADGRPSATWAGSLAGVRAGCSALVNEFFRVRLLAYRRAGRA